MAARRWQLNIFYKTLKLARKCECYLLISLYLNYLRSSPLVRKIQAAAANRFPFRFVYNTDFLRPTKLPMIYIKCVNGLINYLSEGNGFQTPKIPVPLDSVESKTCRGLFTFPAFWASSLGRGQGQAGATNIIWFFNCRHKIVWARQQNVLMVIIGSERSQRVSETRSGPGLSVPIMHAICQVIS